MNIGQIKDFQKIKSKNNLYNIDIELNFEFTVTKDDITEISLPQIFSKAMKHYIITIPLGKSRGHYQKKKDTYISEKFYKFNNSHMSFITESIKYMKGLYYFFWIDEYGKCFVEVTDENIKIPLTSRGLD